MLLIINYHYIGMKKFPFPGVNGLSTNEFSKQLKYLKKNFKIISLSDLPLINLKNKNCCLITFDDGLRCHYDIVFPILKKQSTPAAFFVNTKPLIKKKAIFVHKYHLAMAHTNPKELILNFNHFCRDNKINLPKLSNKKIKTYYRYDNSDIAKIKYFINYFLTKEKKEEFINPIFKNIYSDEIDFIKKWYINEIQIREMNKEFECIGSHAHSHLPLSQLSNKESEYEMKLSKSALENIVKKEITYISYPSGNKNAVNRRDADLAKKIGYKYGFTMEREINHSLKDPLLLARIDCNDLPEVGKSPIFKIKGQKFFDNHDKVSKRKEYYQE